MSRIENIIDDIERYLDECKPAAFSSSKIVVNKIEIDELLKELRDQIPEEVAQYQKIINNQSAIINNAKMQAEGMVDAANKLQSQMINEHEIMQQAIENSNQVIQNANLQASAILDRATMDRDNMQRAIMKYTDDMMGILQKELEDIMNNSKQKFDSFYQNLENSYNKVINNRNELNNSMTSDEEQQY